MAKLELSLSNKTLKDSNKSEILIRFFNGSVFNMRARSEVYINPSYFEYYINRSATEKAGIKVPAKLIYCTKDKASKNKYILRNSGEIITSGRKLRTEEVEYHESQAKKIADIKAYIMEQYLQADKDDVKGDWLKKTVENFLHPDKATAKDNENIFQLFESYIQLNNFSYDHTKHLHALMRTLARYEGFVKDTQNEKFVLDINTITREDIENFRDYVRNEKSLSERYPELFAKLKETYPLDDDKRKRKSSFIDRGENTVIKTIKHLKAFFNWLYQTQRTTNKPFDGIKVGSEKYFGDPYYLTVEERNKISEFDFGENTRLQTQADIFIFHCYVGCRVSDLIKLTSENIHNGILLYHPHKTKDEQESEGARVPLHKHALELIEKYKGKDTEGRLFPFISPQKYNQAIKDVLTAVEIKRNVVIRDSVSGEPVIKPINEIASSHMARRTFIGNAYQLVSDPSIIGKMSGHVDGSRAFSRYRKIEDSTLTDIINKL